MTKFSLECKFGCEKMYERVEVPTAKFETETWDTKMNARQNLDVTKQSVRRVCAE